MSASGSVGFFLVLTSSSLCHLQRVRPPLGHFFFLLPDMYPPLFSSGSECPSRTRFLSVLITSLCDLREWVPLPQSVSFCILTSPFLGTLSLWVILYRFFFGLLICPLFSVLAESEVFSCIFPFSVFSFVFSELQSVFHKLESFYSDVLSLFSVLLDFTDRYLACFPYIWQQRRPRYDWYIPTVCTCSF